MENLDKYALILRRWLETAVLHSMYLFGDIWEYTVTKYIHAGQEQIPSFCCREIFKDRFYMLNIFLVPCHHSYLFLHLQYSDLRSQFMQGLGKGNNSFWTFRYLLLFFARLFFKLEAYILFRQWNEMCLIRTREICYLLWVHFGMPILFVVSLEIIVTIYINGVI